MTTEKIQAVQVISHTIIDFLLFFSIAFLKHLMSIFKSLVYSKILNKSMYAEIVQSDI